MKLYVYCAKSKKERNGMFFTVANSKKEIQESGSYVIVDINDMERYTFNTYIEETPANNIKVIYTDEYNSIVEYKDSSNTYRIMINYEYNHIANYTITIIK